MKKIIIATTFFVSISTFNLNTASRKLLPEEESLAKVGTSILFAALSGATSEEILKAAHCGFHLTEDSPQGEKDFHLARAARDGNIPLLKHALNKPK